MAKGRQAARPKAKRPSRAGAVLVNENISDSDDEQRRDELAAGKERIRFDAADPDSEDSLDEEAVYQLDEDVSSDDEDEDDEDLLEEAMEAGGKLGRRE